MLKAYNAKEELRRGWVVHKISNKPEHVADHLFSSALMSYIFATRRGLDAGRCAEMALVHDVYKAVGGDIPTRTYKKDWVITPEEHGRLAERDTAKMLSLLPERDAREIHKLWREYVQQKTKEAQLVKGIDKLDFIIQSILYSKNVRDKERFRDFFVDAKRSLKDKDLVYIMKRAEAEVFRK